MTATLSYALHSLIFVLVLVIVIVIVIEYSKFGLYTEKGRAYLNIPSIQRALAFLRAEKIDYEHDYEHEHERGWDC